MTNDAKVRLAGGEEQLSSRSWRNAPSRGSGRLDTNPVAPSLPSFNHSSKDSDARSLQPQFGPKERRNLSALKPIFWLRAE